MSVYRHETVRYRSRMAECLEAHATRPADERLKLGQLRFCPALAFPTAHALTSLAPGPAWTAP